MKYMLCFCLFFCASMTSVAQQERESKSETKDQLKSFEIGIDVTSALSMFVGNEALAIDATPFLMRFHNKKNSGAFRLGLGGILDRGEFVDVIAGVVRQTQLTAGSLKVGYEKNVHNSAKLSFYYGVDLLAYYERDLVTAANFFPIDLIKTINRFGIGPLIGISYTINPRIRLTTEASLSIFIEESKSIERLDGAEQVVSSDSGLSGGINPPFSLFINARF